MKRAKKKVNKKKMKSKDPTKKPLTKPSWVDNVRFSSPSQTPFESSEADGEHPLQLPDISVVSWNVLAEAYCSRRSQRNLPPEYQRVVFSNKRRRIILEKLEQMNSDVFLLQEVDMDEIEQHLGKLGYEGVESPRTRGGSPGRVDACGIYVRSSRWTIIEHEVVSLDDLAFLKTSDSRAQSDLNSDTQMNGNLQGLQQSFLRRKMALVARLKCIATGRTVVVANAHLYWNPGFEYVKLCQAHYVLQRVSDFRRTSEPIIFGGDLNSRPQGAVYSYMRRGWIDAKSISPWVQLASEDDFSDMTDDEIIEKRMENFQIGTERPVIRYLLDASLNKLCRWLRILGQDAALETEEEEKERTGKGNFILFRRCAKEQRTLVTTSKRLMERKDCPSGTYCINPQVLPNLEVCMVHMLLTHGVVLEPKKFLGRCVVCNGSIVVVEHPGEKRKIVESYQAPTALSETEVFQCDNKECGQGYWWSEIPTSSASRVKTTATRLFELCIQAGVPYVGGLDIFDSVDVDRLRKEGWDFSAPGSEILRDKLQVVEWLGSEKLVCPFSLKSVYGIEQNQESVYGETLNFTNVTSDFVNVLDYIFYVPEQLQIYERLYIPSTFEEMNDLGLRNGHLVPSDRWPSDHLAVGASFRILNLQQVNDETNLFCAPIGSVPQATEQIQLKVSQAHGRRCDCGCIPPVPSLFEMAELRRKARIRGQPS